MNLYSFAKSAVFAILKPIYRFEVIGAENVSERRRNLIVFQSY